MLKPHLIFSHLPCHILHICSHIPGYRDSKWVKLQATNVHVWSAIVLTSGNWTQCRYVYYHGKNTGMAPCTAHFVWCHYGFWMEASDLWCCYLLLFSTHTLKSWAEEPHHALCNQHYTHLVWIWWFLGLMMGWWFIYHASVAWKVAIDNAHFILLFHSTYQYLFLSPPPSNAFPGHIYP